ncbi:MAG: hypothetical protein P4L53_11530 [Candidatus Obscuribacterales bacterium]|nr:hypothetical protein [Candidatus Obscuribacterales bacterium]
MRYQTALSFALFSFLSLQSVALSAPATKAATPSKAATVKSYVREYSFPTDYPIGALKLLGVERLGSENIGNGIGPAQGKLSINVPPDHTIMLDVNPHCLEHPERLKNVNIAGINRLKMSYLAMEDLDHSICDKAMQTLPECKDLVALHIDRSDVTDKGLSSFKSLPSIKYLYASGANLDGSFLKEPQKLKSLEDLNLIFNPLKSANLKYLSALPHLAELVLNQSNLSDSDLSNLAKCTQIKRLYLLGNPKITDKSLPLLRGLTNLEVLDVRGTSITFEGVLSLKTLKLKRLNITVRRYRPSELEQLTKAFPKAYLNYRGEGVGEENQVYFAPLK